MQRLHGKWCVRLGHPVMVLLFASCFAVATHAQSTAGPSPSGTDEKTIKRLKREWEQKLAVAEKAGKDDPRVVEALLELGRLALLRSDFAAAYADYWKALWLQERTLGPQHLDIASTMDQLAAVLTKRMGCQYRREIMQLLQGPLSYSELINLDPSQPNPFSGPPNSVDGQATCFTFPDSSYWMRAVRWMSLAVAIRRQHWGRDAPNLAPYYEELGNLQSKIGSRKSGQWAHAEARRLRLLELQQSLPQLPLRQPVVD